VATIVLVHGLWVTPRCWEHWVARYERQGHRVLAPAYPGLDRPVEALRADPSPIAALTPAATLAHLSSLVRSLDRPIVIGHCFGGVLARGLAPESAAAVALHALPAAGAGTPGTVSLSPEQFHYALANFEGADGLYERYVVPAPGTWAWDAPPGHALEVAGSEDNVAPRVGGARVMPGRTHLTILQPGWEAVADEVLEWALHQ
jgi:alpha-beta hydrolase superfamily lysophospholipase